MSSDLAAARAFGALLREDPQLAACYDRCTPAQKQHLLLRLAGLKSSQEVQALAKELSNAAP